MKVNRFNGKNVLRVSTAIRRLSVLAFAVCAFSSVAASRPNLVLIYCDDLGYGDTGFTGHPIIKTPNLDRLASQGVIFNNNYSGAPHCSPSRVALMLGKASYRVGVYDIIGRGEMNLPEEETTIAELLRDAGYDTYHGGKWHMNRGPGDHALRHGFNHTADPGMATDVVADFARWMKKGRDGSKPFFAYLAFHESHMPVEKWAPERFRAMYRPIPEEAFKTIQYGGDRVSRKANPRHREVYYGCVSQLDSAVGDLVNLLKDSGAFDNTFIYFSSDNGPEHRNAYSWGTPGAMRGAKGHLHDGGIHVPGFAVWPGHVKPNTKSDTPISAWDVLPTFCELAGTEPTEGIDGVSFLEATEGKPLARKTPLYWSWWNARGGCQYVMRDGDWKILGITEPKPPDRSVVEHIKNAYFVGFELYNLKDDPNENTDLASKKPEVLERLKAKFLLLHRDIVAEGPVVRMNADPGTGQPRKRKTSRGKKGKK